MRHHQLLRWTTGATLLATLCLSYPAAASAQGDYPAKTIRLVAPFAPGGGTDGFARRFMPSVGGGIGPKIIVDNKPGANSIIATQAVTQAPPDGYTLLLQTNSLVVNPFIQKELPFDTAKDLVPVSHLSRTPHVLVVTKSLQAKTLRELVEYGKANPRVLNYGSGGVGSTNHLAGEMFAKLAGLQMEHVAYKGSSEYVRDLTPGTIQMVFAGADQATSLTKAGTVRPIATTGAKRLPELPDVPTMAEAGYPLEIYSWTGVFVPARTPPAIVNKLAQEFAKAARDPKVRQALPAYELIGSTPQEFTDFLKKETLQVGALVKSIDLSAVSQPKRN